MRVAPLPAATVVFCLLLASAGAGADSGTAEQLFRAANDAYEAGDFPEAVRGYLKCIEAGGNGADALFNLGNAYARRHELGKALAAYEAALMLAPRDPDIRRNMEQVATQRVESAPGVPRSWFQSVCQGFLRNHTLNELTVLCTLLGLVLTGLSLRLLLGTAISRRQWAAFSASAVLFLICVALCFAKYEMDWKHPGAYFAGEQVTVRSGPGDHFEVVGQFTDGVRIEPERRSGLWTEVRLPTGGRGWALERSLSRVNPAAER